MPSRTANEALEVILADYQRYHAVLVVLAGIFLAAAVVLVVVCWRALRAARRSPGGASRRQRWTYGSFAATGVLVSLFLLLIIAANLSNVIDPQAGFAGVDQSRGAIAAWLASGSPTVPTEVQDAISARLAWQRPKAVIVMVLLVAAATASVIIWRRFVERRSSSRSGSLLLFSSGVVTAGFSLLLMLMVMGNVQAIMVPMPLTLAYG